MGNNLANDTLFKIVHNTGIQPAHSPGMTVTICIHRMCWIQNLFLKKFLALILTQNIFLSVLKVWMRTELNFLFQITSICRTTWRKDRRLAAPLPNIISLSKQQGLGGKGSWQGPRGCLKSPNAAQGSRDGLCLIRVHEWHTALSVAKVSMALTQMHHGWFVGISRCWVVQLFPWGEWWSQGWAFSPKV